jgi:hypothetical protein
MRVLITKALLTDSVPQLRYYKLGKWIRLGEAPFYCGDRTQFDIILKDGPSLGIAPWSDSEGLPGTSLSFAASARAQVHGCLADPLADAGLSAGANVSLLSGSAIRLRGNLQLTLLGIGFGIPFESTVNTPAELAGFPVTLSETADVSMEFGSGTLASWIPNSDPKKRQIPVTVRLSAFDEYLSVDASVGAERRLTFSTPALAQQYWRSDVPLWEARNAGVSIREAFFGMRDAAGKGSGLLGQLLPIRARAVLRTRVLGFFPVTTKADVLLNGESVRYIAHEGKPAVEVLLLSSEANIDGKHVVAGSDTFLRSVSGRVLFDRFRLEGNKIGFRVADFRVLVKSRWLIFPIGLSSGALEATLNGGTIDVGGIQEQVVELPKCIPNAGEKFISTPGACGEPPEYNGLIGRLGHLAGNRLVHFSFDPSTLGVRSQEAEIDGKAWKSMQVGGKIVVNMSGD